jgi:hypothetical protein
MLCDRGKSMHSIIREVAAAALTSVGRERLILSEGFHTKYQPLQRAKRDYLKGGCGFWRTSPWCERHSRKPERFEKVMEIFH